MPVAFRLISIMPDNGNNGISAENTISNMIPVQNTGAEYPTRENTVTTALNMPSGLREAKTPRNVPMQTDNISAVTTSKMVGPSRSRISSNTGLLKNRESPRSPLNMRCM